MGLFSSIGNKISSAASSVGGWASKNSAALVGGLADLVSSGINSAVQYGSAKSLAKYNYELGQRSLLESPSNYVQGLEAAGINPMLAAGATSIGSTQGSSGVGSNIDMVGGASSAVDAYKKSEEARAVEATIKRTQAEEKAITKNAESAQWQLYDAHTLGAAGFDVVLKGGLKVESVQSIRINKVTGRAYTVPQNQPIESIKTVLSSAPKSDNVQPSNYQQNNYYYNSKEDNNLPRFLREGR